MLTALRHLLAFLALPFVVTVVVPRYLLRAAGTATDPAGPLVRHWLIVLGAALLLIGLTLFVSSLHHFATRGRGTLAPWDPPRHLVVTGPYRFVRNPMISGVVFILFAEAALFRSTAILGWAVTFLLINAGYIPLVEEPGLVRRFGEPYREYRRHVHRFIPRLRPWRPGPPPSDPA